MRRTDTDHGSNAALLIVVTFALLVVPMAGCIGGADSGGTSSDGDPGNVTDDGDDNDDGPGPGGVPSDSDDNAHVHDRWYDSADQRPGSGASSVDKITLIDSTHTISSVQEDPNAPLDGCRISGERFCWGMEIVTADSAGEDAGTYVVPPGTDKVTVEVSYDQGEYDGVYVAYQHAGTSGTQHWKELAKRPEGAEAGWTTEITDVDINDDATPDPDNGHAEVSQWRFAIEVAGNPAPVVGVPSMTGPDGLEVQLTVEAHRGDELPLEPPHPTFYDKDPAGDTSVYEIARLDGETGQFFQAGPAYGVSGGCLFETGVVCLPARTGSGLVWRAVPGYDGPRGADDSQQLDPERAVALVPPKTKVLEAVMRVDGEAFPAEQAEICLRYRQGTADDRLGQPFGSSGCVTYTGQEELNFTLPVDSQWDSFYANNWGGNNSRWSFLVQIRSPYSGVTAANTFPVHEPGTFSGSFETVVLATDEASLSETPSWIFE